jgi:hypothetical protein
MVEEREPPCAFGHPDELPRVVVRSGVPGAGWMSSSHVRSAIFVTAASRHGRRWIRAQRQP